MSDDGDPDRTQVSVVDPLAGTTLDDRYRIEFRLAQGGFGSVYRARHAINGREVAIKVLRPQLARDPGVVERFRREARALGQLKNPHTITGYDFGETADGTLYIVMELLHGESLYEHFRAHGPLPWPRVVAIIRAVCSSLAEAHALGIVHRDLKPANIHLEKRGDQDDYVKVLDFGIAKILHGSVADTANITHAGQVVGTFEYMAPEQLVGGAVDGRSDVFALGVLMYETITGERPFGSHATASAMISAILAGAPPALSARVPAPAELDALVLRCMQWEPPHRYASVEELSAALETLHTVDDDHAQTLVERGEDVTWTDAPPDPPARPAPFPKSVISTLPGVVPPKRRR